MKLLEDYIVEKGKVIGDDILKIDMFLNHLIDVDLLNEMGKEFHRLFGSKNVTKILTIEASGIGIACIAAQYFSVPVLFAKKGMHRNVGSNLYTADIYSYTKGITTTVGVSKDYLTADDRVLIIDDFLADGNASLGLLDLIAQAGATLAGIGIAVEKGFQNGRSKLLAKGCDLESLAVIKSMEGGKIVFASPDDLR
ncbi:MAG TPA: xanthine phosphoribosyltransferase [Ruminococcaceae bacterium]|nr:xanthine phosphoribosyltransferase [Oscillospiraceae bacterium]